MNLKTIANFALKNEDFKGFVNKFATDEQIDFFLTEATKNKEFKNFQNNIFRNIIENDGYRYASNGEDKYQSALDFATKTIAMFENDYANNMSGKYENGKIDLRALGFNDTMFEQYGDIIKSFDLDGDIESFSAEEVASYILALDEQGNKDGIITLDDIKNIDVDKLQQASRSNFNSYA